ncbi:ATP-binding protein [Streptomyces sp. NPDC091416]|uniref:ATP-binding protein n=1 Tax=Streptomyces sp. NPDC091416 TaxID=3366003 RepID=UPI0038171FCB
MEAVQPRTATPAAPAEFSAGAPDTAIAAMAASMARTTRPGQAVLTDRDARWPGQMRLTACSYLHRWGLWRLADAAALLITELVTNALRYGLTDSIELRMIHTTRTVRIEVRGGTADAGVRTLGQASAFDECGRGLFLVDALADAWGVAEDGSVWCSLSLTEGRTS